VFQKAANARWQDLIKNYALRKHYAEFLAPDRMANRKRGRMATENWQAICQGNTRNSNNISSLDGYSASRFCKIANLAQRLLDSLRCKQPQPEKKTWAFYPDAYFCQYLPP
jgi:hypothetical protein